MAPKLKKEIWKRKLLVGAIVLVVVAFSTVFYAVTALSDGVEIGEAALLALPLLVIIGFAFFWYNRYREVKKGHVMEDERSSKVMTHAMARAYLVSIYWLLAIGFFEEYEPIKSMAPGTVSGLGILGMAILFGLFYIYTDRFDTSLGGCC